jgi:prepilin-type N-terminal cleavage/methylation domain-containing protein
MSKAFTLLELLVVITIIGILSSIVIVSMSGSTDSADIAKGKSYDQQIHALLGYEAVLDLNFNENAYNSCPDGKDVCDASGYNNNGDISNNEAAYILNPVGGYALSFDGINDRITIADSSSLDVREAITLTVWVNTDSYSGSKALLYVLFKADLA